MEETYKYETFGSEAGVFDREFSGYLNRMRQEGWKVKSCSFCHGGADGKRWSSCIFKKHV